MRAASTACTLDIDLPGAGSSRPAHRRNSSRSMSRRLIASSSTRPSRSADSRDDTSMSARSALTVRILCRRVRSLSNRAPDWRPRTPVRRVRDRRVETTSSRSGCSNPLSIQRCAAVACDAQVSQPKASTLARRIWCHDCGAPAIAYTDGRISTHVPFLSLALIWASVSPRPSA